MVARNITTWPSRMGAGRCGVSLVSNILKKKRIVAHRHGRRRRDASTRWCLKIQTTAEGGDAFQSVCQRMSCMPVLNGSRTGRALQVQVIIDQPITPLSYGRITCVADGLAPIVFQWRGPHGREIQLDSTGSEAYGLTPGRYTVHVESADGRTADVSADVAPNLKRVVAVNEYECTPASSGVASDGSVRAHGYGMDQWGRYLWSNGVETAGPFLQDVRPGCYSLCPLPMDREAPVFVQYCAPGVVEVARITRL